MQTSHLPPWLRTALVAALFGIAAGPGRGLAQVVTPVAATASSTYGGQQNPVNLINGSGLLGSGAVITRKHDANTSAATMWHSSGGAVATNVLIFDLGTQYTLNGAYVWQMNQPCCLGRGIKTFGLFTSSDAAGPITTYVGSFGLAQGSGTVNEGAQTLVFSASNVRRVMFAISNCWSGAANDYVGLSEVRFDGTAPASIVTQPQDATNYVWGLQNFTVTVAGTAPLNYQWYRSGIPSVPILGATNATCTIDPVEALSAGGYFVIVSNALNSVTSMVATLTVLNPSPDITTALVAYYAFDETNGVMAADSSGNGSGATLSNFPFDDTMWVTGRVGGALQFNATDASNDDTVLTDAPLNLVNEDYFTFAFWAKRRSDNNPYNPRIIGPVSPVDGEYWVVWAPALNGIGFYPPAPSPVPIRDVWQHFVITYDRLAGRYETYVDGRKKAEATSTAYLKTTPAGRLWAIGCKEILGDYRDPWRGYLDDVRVYNRILLPGDVKALFEVAGSVAPTFDTQPVGKDLFVGDTLSLYAAVDGTPPVAYQWFRDRTNLLAGATNLTLTITNIQVMDAGDYTMVAANALKTATSAVAHVTVTAITSVSSGLAGYWKFDEISGSTAADSSGKGNAGTVNNLFLDGGHWTTGQVGGALTFRGETSGGDYVVVPTWPKAHNGTMSLSAWVWADARPSWASIVCGGSGIDGVGQFTANLYPTSSDFVGFVQNSSRLANGVREGVLFPTNQWQHVALVADDGWLRIYRNGLEVGSVAYDGTLFAPTNALSIGVTLSPDDAGPDSVTPGYWEGKLDDVAYWTRGLTATEVFALFAAGVNGSPVTGADAYTNAAPIVTSQPENTSVYLHEPLSLAVTASSLAPPTYQWQKDGVPIANATDRIYTQASVELAAAGAYRVILTAANRSTTSAVATVTVLAPTPQPDTGMVLHLEFDETSGATAADTSPNANHAYLLNFADPNASWVPGLFGGALSFNQGAPSSDVAVVPAQPYLDFGTGAFSLSLWAKGPPAQTGSGGLLCKGISPGESYCIDFVNGSYRFFVRNSAGQDVANLAIQSGAAPNNQWQHLAVIYDPVVAQSRMYVNGTLAGTAVTADSPYSNFDTLDIGARQGASGYTYNWTGLLDDVRVYGRAITPIEVRALTYQGIPPALTISGNGVSVKLSWPQEAVDYELVSSTSLSGANWTLVPGVTGNVITLPAGGSEVFFRLRRK
jgi:hypothetical protein